MDETNRRSGASSSLADIRLEIMPQLSELRDAQDDWTGKTGTEERRRIQNRLSQRTYRRKKKLQKANIAAAVATSADAQSQRARSTSPKSDNEEGIRMLDCPESRVIAYSFLAQVQQDLSLRAMRPTYLPALIRLNVFNALGHNAIAMGFQVEGLCSAESISPFNRFGPGLPDHLASLRSCPDNLRPTALQLSVTHHPWLDLFPFPQMRDNMIQAFVADIFDSDELCFDIAYFGDGCDVKKSALIVWGESWDVRSWEASVEFLQKWGWLVQGCPEVIESTNHWRQMRGEKMLDIRL